MKLFVYGTLKSGEVNNYLLAGQYLGLAKLSNHILLDIGCPAVIEGNGIVIGELWEVADFELTDQLEGHPYLYIRKELELTEPNVVAWVYLLNVQHLASPNYVNDLGDFCRNIPPNLLGCVWWQS